VSSLHYDSDWHGDYRPSDDAKSNGLKGSASQQSSDAAPKPVVFTNVVHSPPTTSTRHESSAIALIGRLFPAQLRRLLSFRDPEAEPSLLEMARRAKRSKT
jgi:hypothetical protein